MVSNSNRLPSVVQRALDECGLPWRIEHGRQHRRIIVAGVQVGVLHFGASRNHGWYGYANIISAIKRRARQGAE